MKIISPLVSYITRPRVIILLICITLASGVLGTIIPQIGSSPQSLFDEWQRDSPLTYFLVNTLQLNRIYSSAWFVLLVFIIELALGYSLYRQIRTNLARARGHGPPHFSSLLRVALADGQVEPWVLCRVMKKKGFRNRPSGEAGFLFEKHPVSQWGNVIFHAGLFVIIAAGLLLLTMGQRGFLQILEKELVVADSSKFLEQEVGVLRKNFDTGMTVQLLEFVHDYWENDDLKEVKSRIRLIDKDEVVHSSVIENSKPLRVGNISIMQTTSYGLAPAFTLTRPNNTRTAGHFMLNRPSSRTAPARARISFPETPYLFDMQLYPDISMNSRFLNKPIMHLTVYGVFMKKFFEGLIVPGDTVRIEDNTLRFETVAQWSGLVFKTALDTTLVSFGFLLVIVGGSLHFLFPMQRIVYDARAKTLSVSGKRRGNEVFLREELEEIAREIEGGNNE